MNDMIKLSDIPWKELGSRPDLAWVSSREKSPFEVGTYEVICKKILSTIKENSVEKLVIIHCIFVCKFYSGDMKVLFWRELPSQEKYVFIRPIKNEDIPKWKIMNII